MPKQPVKSENAKANAEIQSSWKKLSERFNKINQTYAGLPYDTMFSAFAQAGAFAANEPHIQNTRIKAISSLPSDYTKDKIGEFLRNVYESEQPLRSTAETLSWTAYPFFKLVKTYADIPTYHNYVKPLYIDGETAKTKEFQREAMLLDKFSRELNPEKCAHKIVGQAMKQGKVFYTIRYDVDKVHNKVNAAFMQQLPEDYCMIIGHNNISGYTVSFNMMYFMQPGTSVYAFGDLFEPYLDDFNDMFSDYASRSRRFVYCKGHKLGFDETKVKSNAIGNPRVEFTQDGEWLYWVSLPIDKVWVFEIDDSTPAVASPLAGLFLTYAQQADYEATQLSLLMNPLIKIFTATTPYFTDNGATDEDGFRMSFDVRLLFQTMFDQLMSAHNTSGTALFSMPALDIKSHDFAESANANDISSSFNQYAGSKAGLAALIPVDKDIKAAQVEASRLIESRYSTAAIYPQFCRMMNMVYANLNLKYEWEFVMFGTIFTDEKIREDADKAIANGDISAHFILSALDGDSWIGKLSQMRTIKESGLLELLTPPQTAYTQSAKSEPKSDTGGRPKDTTAKGISDAEEKAIDAGITEG